jgi:hypothetical protein
MSGRGCRTKTGCGVVGEALTCRQAGPLGIDAIEQFVGEFFFLKAPPCLFSETFQHHGPAAADEAPAKSVEPWRSGGDIVFLEAVLDRVVRMKVGEEP